MGTELSDIDPTGEEKHLKDSIMYLGVGVMNYINSVDEVQSPPEMKEEFFKRCRAFLCVASS